VTIKDLLDKIQALTEMVDEACDALTFLLEKGGEGSGGARQGAGRPRSSGDVQRIQSFVRSSMGKMSASEKVDTVCDAFSKAGDKVFGGVETLDEAKKVLKEEGISFDKVQEGESKTTFLLKGNTVIATLKANGDELSIHRGNIPKEQVEGWSEDKVTREMVDLVETDPKIGKEWRQRARDSHEDQQTVNA
jgi:hypothetical protein